MRNLRLDICYDGTRYQGWQRQPGDIMTIQGKLETALSRILEEPVEVFGSGRTDTGVHAKGQVANFHCKNPMPADEILRQLRRYLPDDIGIYSCREVSERFHARLNARRKTYCYRIWNSEEPCVFEKRFVTPIPEKLDLEAMRSAANCFLGEHDFGAFCTNRKTKKSTVRTIYSCDVERIGKEIRVTVTGNGFLHNMVRILVGTLLEVGMHTRDGASIPGLFGGKREEAGAMAPARGLCMMEVIY
ncbi:MAG: tRNA pseudouridine(38-40) synthase TruA [Faecousia sp.]